MWLLDCEVKFTGWKPTAFNIFAMPAPLKLMGGRGHRSKHLCNARSPIKAFGRARLLPSLRRLGSAGASPSRVTNSLDRLLGNMFTAVGRAAELAIKAFGRARLLPSLRLYGSAGASPSRVTNSLGRLLGNMFTAGASPPHPRGH